MIMLFNCRYLDKNAQDRVTEFNSPVSPAFLLLHPKLGRAVFTMRNYRQ